MKDEKKKAILEGKEFQVIGSIEGYKLIDKRIHVKVGENNWQFHAKCRMDSFESHTNVLYCYNKILGKQVFATVHYDNIQIRTEQTTR